MKANSWFCIAWLNHSLVHNSAQHTTHRLTQKQTDTRTNAFSWLPSAIISMRHSTKCIGLLDKRNFEQLFRRNCDRRSFLERFCANRTEYNRRKCSTVAHCQLRQSMTVHRTWFEWLRRIEWQAIECDRWRLNSNEKKSHQIQRKAARFANSIIVRCERFLHLVCDKFTFHATAATVRDIYSDILNLFAGHNEPANVSHVLRRANWCCYGNEAQ